MSDLLFVPREELERLQAVEKAAREVRKHIGLIGITFPVGLRAVEKLDLALSVKKRGDS